MALDVIDSILEISVPLGKISLEQVLDQALGVFVKGPRELDLALQDFLVNEHRVVIRKRVNASQHFVEEDPEAPPVHWLSVSFVQQHFWSQVLWSSTQSVGSVFHVLRKTKVCQLQITFFVYKYIFRLQISKKVITIIFIVKNSL